MNVIKMILNIMRKDRKSNDSTEDNLDCQLVTVLDCHGKDGTIQLGRTSLLNQSIRPVIQFDNADLDSVRAYLTTLLQLSSDTEDYYIRFMDINEGDTWYHISRSEFLEIKKLDSSASLSDIIDKVNEIVEYLNNSMK